MNDGFCMERDAMIPDQGVNCFQHEVDLQGLAHHIGERLLCEGIRYHGQIAEGSVVGNVGNIR